MVNSPFKNAYSRIWAIEFSIGFDDNVLRHPLQLGINEGLMYISFYVIGLELKREFIAVELSSAKKATLPMAATLGGMLVRAAIYSLVNY